MGDLREFFLRSRTTLELLLIGFILLCEKRFVLRLTFDLAEGWIAGLFIASRFLIPVLIRDGKQCWSWVNLSDVWLVVPFALIYGPV